MNAPMSMSRWPGLRMGLLRYVLGSLSVVMIRAI